MRTWSAKWIEYTDCAPGAAPVFRKTFVLDATAAPARLYICGLGFYDCTINDRNVTDALLQPAFSKYDARVFYNEYEVSALLQAGENMIEVTLGNGWYHAVGEDCFSFEHAAWKAPPQLICELVMDDCVVVASDLSWQCARSRTVYSSLRYGELLDEQGNVTQANIKRHATIPRTQTDEYTLAGAGSETWHARFGYKGFRYVQVQGDPVELSMEARVYHTDLEDAYEKWLDDLVDCQRPSGQLPCIAPTSVYGYGWGSGATWDSAVCFIPWELYRFTGDASCLARYYGAMRKYVQYVERTSDDLICRIGLGDWCAPREAPPGSVGAWFFKSLAGICVAESAPGFSHIVLRPHFVGDVKTLSAWHDTPRGRLTLFYDLSRVVVTLPPDTTATLHLGGREISMASGSGPLAFDR